MFRVGGGAWVQRKTARLQTKKQQYKSNCKRHLLDGEHNYRSMRLPTIPHFDMAADLSARTLREAECGLRARRDTAPRT